MADTYVIVGASLCGATAAATLRSEGFDGRLVMVGAEDRLPYERPPLSKGYLRDEEPFDQALIRPEEWYATNEIDLRLGTPADVVDVASREVVMPDGERMAYDALLVATGGRNRPIDAEGADLPGIFHLRTIEECDAIKEAAAGGVRVVCVGMGFIGSECAASLSSIGCDVTVVEFGETTLNRVLGGEIGRTLEALHRDHGIEMHFNEAVERFEGDGRVERVVTRSGLTVDCEIAVVGVGTMANADVMRDSGLDVTRGVPVDASLRTEIPGVFAAGDVALHDHPVFGSIRVEHFDNAIKMGEAVARSMLGKTDPFDDPHWFWSDQYDSNVQMAGFATSWASTVVRGSMDDRSFCAFLLDEAGVLLSTFSLDWKRDVRRSFELIRKSVAPDRAALADPEIDLRTLVPE